ncbi:MAG: hypothetical protein N3G74_01215 [Candidatus Micrarchaeota archaeon]|nr:hypothetical protein [Candidatus Micrarchaeota archaeon]
MKKLGVLMALFLLGSLIFAETGSASEAGTNIKKVLSAICNLSAGLLGPIAFVLFALAGVVYAGSQFFGAEARATGSKWAMTMITGAIVAFLLWIIGPMIISELGGGTYRIGTSACTGF